MMFTDLLRFMEVSRVMNLAAHLLYKPIICVMFSWAYFSQLTCKGMMFDYMLLLRHRLSNFGGPKFFLLLSNLHSLHKSGLLKIYRADPFLRMSILLFNHDSIGFGDWFCLRTFQHPPCIIKFVESFSDWSVSENKYFDVWSWKYWFLFLCWGTGSDQVFLRTQLVSERVAEKFSTRPISQN